MKAFIRLNKKTREIKEITLNKHKTFNINILYLIFYLISSLFPQLIAIYYILPQDMTRSPSLSFMLRLTPCPERLLGLCCQTSLSYG